MFCIPKILKNESNSQHILWDINHYLCCFVSQRYWKMKAIHNRQRIAKKRATVVLYPKDTEKWKQFTTPYSRAHTSSSLFCIPKILKNESNSQHSAYFFIILYSCFVSQRYWKMKAIHNTPPIFLLYSTVVLYPKDTEKWKQFTTLTSILSLHVVLFCIPKILKNESNSQHKNSRVN